MTVYPAVDVLQGKCVRLKQGDFNDKTVYYENPADAALKFAEGGAEFLHLINLDGAAQKNEEASQINAIIKEIKNKTGLKIQVGGGIRNLENIAARLDAGAFRVILGTSAFVDPAFTHDALKTYGEKIAVAIDVKNGLAATHAWKQTSGVAGLALARQMAELGVKTVIYTDISKDGMLDGPNFEALEELINEVKINVIASGGVTTAQDVARLRDLGAAGVIIGKALYAGTISLKDALAAAL